MNKLNKFAWLFPLLLSGTCYAQAYNSIDAKHLVNRSVDVCGIITEINPSVTSPQILIGRPYPYQHIQFNVRPFIFDQIKDSIQTYETLCAHGMVIRSGRFLVINVSNLDNIYSPTTRFAPQNGGIYDGIFQNPEAIKDNDDDEQDNAP
ncbi:hypothetical protein [Acinetobacter sp. P1(2025)]|uniref:hypothetical protein n=1 Tax=Acinetobacter sp. P1(2025) TaxID=3446120 RepID=UPI003F539E28